MSNISSAEGMARIFLSKAKSGGVSDKLDGPWFARKLCEEAGKFIKNGQSLPPTLSDWLAKGLNSAANGESLETALLIKKSKGGTSKYTHDVHSFIVLVAFTAVNQKISINKAIPLVADKHGKSESNLRKIIYSDKFIKPSFFVNALKNINIKNSTKK